MACNLTDGRKEPCKDVVGGIKAVYFVDFTPLNMTLDPSDGSFTDFDDGASPTPADVNGYKYEVRHASSMTSNINSSRETGTTFFETTIELTLKQLSHADNKELKLLAHGRPHIFVLDNNDNIMLVGQEYGCEVTGGTLVTGNAMGDLSGYTLTFTAQERSLPLFKSTSVSVSAFEALFAALDDERGS